MAYGKHFLALVVLCAATVGSHAAPIDTIDPQNLTGGATGGNLASVRVGQSFTPGLDGLDAIEFNLGTQQTPMNVFVNIRDLSAGMNFSGNILGTSATMAVANTTLQTIHFDFASMVALVPGVEVVAEIIFDQDWIIEGGFGNPYAGGAFYDINGTVVIADIELVFTEGLHAARVPEPATLALLGLGLAGPGFSRRKQ